MKHQVFSAFVTVTFLFQNIFAQQPIQSQKISYQVQTPIYIDLIDFEGFGEEVPLIIEDEMTGKKALVNIPKSAQEKHHYTGFFVFQMSGGQSKGNLKLKDKKGDELSVVNHSDEETTKYLGFKNEKSRKAFEDKNQVMFEKAKKAEELRLKKQEQDRLAEFERQKKMDEKKRKEELAKLEAERRLMEKRQEEERLAMELAEAKRLEELRQQQARLSKAEREKRAKKAADLAEAAMSAYKQENYELAEKKFKEAIEFDPSNSKYSFKYGVTLYKNEKYQQSLVVLSSAEGGDYSQAEKYYYTALNLMKIKEFDKAIKEFRATRDEGDKNLSPIAAYMAGYLHYQKEEYKDAKESIEYVLDNSQDPKLDKQAEELLEQIENIEAFTENASKRFKVVLTGGPNYDSNVLSQPTSTATNASSFRLNYGTTLEYRPVYNFFHEFFVDFVLSDVYSMNRNVQTADAQVMSLTTPYKWKTKLGKMAYQMAVTPGAEVIYLDTAGTGKRVQISGSSYLKWDHTLFMSKDWLSVYNLEYRSDSSLMSLSSSDADQTGKRTTLGTAQTYFLDAKNSKSLTGELNLISNAAEGRNQKYSKTELAVTYAAPSMYDSTLSARLSMASSQYPDHSTGRADSLLSGVLGLNFDLNKTLTSNVSLSIAQNSSSLATSAYNKYSLVNTWTWTNLF